MSESLAEYSAPQVMAHKYGRDLMHRFLRHELDGYLRGRWRGPPRTTTRPRARAIRLVPEGGQILYTLADYIGEDKPNLALHNFLMQYQYANANNQVDANNSPQPPCPSTILTRTLACWWTPSGKLHRNSSIWSTTASTASSLRQQTVATSQRLQTESLRSRWRLRRARCGPTATVRKRRCPSTTTSRSVSLAAERSGKPLYPKKEDQRAPQDIRVRGRRKANPSGH